MLGAELIGMREAGGGEQFFQGFQSVFVQLEYALGFVGHDQRARALRILAGNAGRAFAGVTGLRLQTAQGKHETARGVAPVGADGNRARDIEGGDYLGRGTDPDLIA